MIPYLEAKGNNNTIRSMSDLIIYDKNNNEFKMISLCDVNTKNRKVISDLIQNETIILKDLENIDIHIPIKLGYTNKLKFKTEKIDNNISHCLIFQDDIERIIIDWNNEGKIKMITKFIKQKFNLPVDEEIVEKVLNIENTNYKKVIHNFNIYTSNPQFEKLESYEIDQQNFLYYFNKLDLTTDYDCFEWDNINNIEDYIFEFLQPIKEKLKENVRVLYNPNKINTEMFKGRKPYLGQIPIIQSSIEVLKKDRFVYLACEQGFGKTTVASKVIHSYYKEKGNNKYTNLLIVPTITLKQWEQELKENITDSINIYIIKKTVDFIKLYNKTKLKFDKPTFIIVGKETFKLDAKKISSVNIRTVRTTEKEEKYPYRTIVKENEFCCCPQCGILLKPNKKDNEDSKEVFLTKDNFKAINKSNYKCIKCGSVLWSTTYEKTKKVSLIRFIKTKKIIFDNLIIDECHESNNGSSIIGNSIKTSFSYAKKCLLLSGTSNNGYSSSLYNILSGLLSRSLIKDKIFNQQDFIEKYGTLQAINKYKEENSRYLVSGRTSVKDKSFKEIEGINSTVFTKYLCQNYIYAELSDLEKDYKELQQYYTEKELITKKLPPLNEFYIPIQHDKEVLNNEKNLFNNIKRVNKFNAKFYIDSVIKHYTNNPYGWDKIKINGVNGETTVQPQNCKNRILPKEQKLIELIKQEISEGRKVCIYVNFNNGGEYMKGESLPNRLERLLKMNNIKTFQLKPTIKPMDRKELLEQKQNDFDVLITNPSLVKVGLNLVFIPTYIFYMPSYQFELVAQASRRGYRANSTKENRIYHLYYIGEQYKDNEGNIQFEDTIENEIIKRYQRKSAEANAIEGKFNIELENEDKTRTNSIFSKKINESLKVLI